MPTATDLRTMGEFIGQIHDSTGSVVADVFRYQGKHYKILHRNWSVQTCPKSELQKLQQ